jgi:F-type H+-transporting ATPase subunit gamma
MEAFTAGEVDAVYIAFNEFKSIMVQHVVVDQLLPIPRAAFDTPVQTAGTPPPLEYLFEPKPEDLFKSLLPTYVEVQVFRALLESNAAFYAAQMTAMDAATRNSGEMIEQLTLYMNKVRQAAITREIIEVVSGAQAL